MPSHSHVAAPHVFGFLAAPDREATLFAISKALLTVRHSGVTYKDIAKALGVSDDTIANAVAESCLLSTDTVLRLCYFFPDHTGAIRDLILPPTGPLTRNDKLTMAQRLLDEVRDAA